MKLLGVGFVKEVGFKLGVTEREKLRQLHTDKISSNYITNMHDVSGFPESSNQCEIMGLHADNEARNHECLRHQNCSMECKTINLR